MEIDDIYMALLHSFPFSLTVLTPIQTVQTVRLTALYERSKDRITCIESELKDYLQEQRKRLKCPEIAFWGSAKDKYQLEVPEGVLSKNGQVKGQ